MLLVAVSRLGRPSGISSFPGASVRVAAARGLATDGNGNNRRRRRDPPMPPLTNPVEQAIAAAQQRGELNNLRGSGKPLTDSASSRPAVAGMSTSELLSKKAEFEMRRAVQSGELEHLQGEKLEYRGTTIVSTSLSGKSSGGSPARAEKSGADIMGEYILKQAQPKPKRLK